MRIVDASVSEIDEVNPIKKIELVGRVCYKSEDARAEGTDIKMYSNLVQRGHTAMLEHATFVFELSKDLFVQVVNFEISQPKNLSGKNLFLNHTMERIGDSDYRCIISGNLRGINESGISPLLWALYTENPRYVYTISDSTMKDSFEAMKDVFGKNIRIMSGDEVKNLPYSERLFHEYHTLKFITDRGVSHEIVRHRPASYAQESTRYCNYSKDKFGKEISVLRPCFFKEGSVQMDVWESAMMSAEKNYFALLDVGATPQEARTALPTNTKTEIVMTACNWEWRHFLNLRSLGTTGAPHPQMKEVADMAMNVLKDRVFEGCEICD